MSGIFGKLEADVTMVGVRGWRSYDVTCCASINLAQLTRSI
jgi:hypothetical protein